MKKKKVAFLIESFLVGGAEKVLVDIVNHLDPEKFDITVISVFNYSVYKDYDKQFDRPLPEYVHFKTLVNNHIRLLYILFNFLLVRIPNFLFHLLVREHYDTLVAFYEGLPTYWVGKLNPSSTKRIAWLHTTTELSQGTSNEAVLNEQFHLYKNYDQIVAVSKAAAQSFADTFGLSTTVIYNPIDIHAVQEKSLEVNQHPLFQHRTVFISVGRITPCKGYDRAIDIALTLKKRGCDFIWGIIGGGDTSDLEKMINFHSLNEHVQFLGHQSNPYSYIRKADLFLSTSYVEGLGMSLIEALAIGTPVISSNFQAAYEILGKNQYGTICSSNEEFADAIESFLKDPAPFAERIAVGQKQAESFSTEHQLKKIEEIL